MNGGGGGESRNVRDGSLRTSSSGSIGIVIGVGIQIENALYP